MGLKASRRPRPSARRGDQLKVCSCVHFSLLVFVLVLVRQYILSNFCTKKTLW